MRILETKVFSFAELSDEGQAKAIDGLRDINTDHSGWHNPVIEQEIEALAIIGFTDAKIYYSGFSSQGDGACFDAKIDINLYMEKYLILDEDIQIREFLKKNAEHLNYKIEHRGASNLYSHENTRTVDLNMIDMHGLTLKQEKELCTNAAKLCDMLETSRRNISKEIYKNIEKYYNSLQSDEQVKETILANEYEFTQDGKLI